MQKVIREISMKKTKKSTLEDKIRKIVDITSELTIIKRIDQYTGKQTGYRLEVEKEQIFGKSIEEIIDKFIDMKIKRYETQIKNMKTELKKKIENCKYKLSLWKKNNE